jgi:uncharacterized protein YmfQ (DUF2313 family)
MTSSFRFLAATFCVLVLHTDTNAADPLSPKPVSAPATVEKSDKPPRVLVTISKETTYITEPLRPDGYVDYVAALNARYSKGVTPENNAAVLFWKAVGPGLIEPATREEFFKALGMKPLPDKGDYFIQFDDYVKERRKAVKGGVGLNEKEIATAEKILKIWTDETVRPWSRDELPILAEWLKANERPLHVIVEACKRPRRFDPIVVSDKESALLFSPVDLTIYTAVADALVARALNRLDSNEIEKAWDDLLATHRLARLVGQGSSLVESLDGISIDAIADAGDQALLQRTLLTPSQAAKMLKDLNRLASFPDVAELVDGTERFQYLGAVACCARGVSKEFAKIISGMAEKAKAARAADQTQPDWDVMLRIGNHWYTRMTKALHHRQPTQVARNEAWGKMMDDYYARIKTLTGKVSITIDAILDPRGGSSERIAFVLLAELLPAGNNVAIGMDRGSMRLEITKLGFAMAAYHADHGSYPSTLAELAPRYVGKVPKDVFNDNELHYKLKLKRESYVIYSVGPNGKDDGGKEPKNGMNDEDDIALTVPAPEAPNDKP